MGRKRTWIVENTWKCDSCGEKNKGRHMECQKCGSPKEKHEKYDTSGNLSAPAVSDPDLLRKAKAGANWTCKYCKYDCRDLFDECESCGADRWEGKHHRVAKTATERGISTINDERAAKGERLIPTRRAELYLEQERARRAQEAEEIDPRCPTCGSPGVGPCACEAPEGPQRRLEGGSYREAPTVVEDPSDLLESLADAITDEPEPPRRLSWGATRAQIAETAAEARAYVRKKKQAFLIATIVVPLGAVAGVLIWIFTPREVETTIADTTWDHTRVLEQRQQNHGSGWDETVPSGAFNESCHRKFRTTEQCNPHDCMCRTVTDYCSVSCNCTESCTPSCTDNGNGFSTCTESCYTTCSTCQEPCGSHEECSTCWDTCDVYDQWCEYDYFTWPEVDREVVKGHGPATRWGTELRTDPDAPAPQRIRKLAQYDVIFTDGEDRWEIEPNTLADFQQYAPEERWLIKVNIAGQVWPLHEVRDEGEDGEGGGDRSAGGEAAHGAVQPIGSAGVGLPARAGGEPEPVRG
jgi:hypothetical protein